MPFSDMSLLGSALKHMQQGGLLGGVKSPTVSPEKLLPFICRNPCPACLLGWQYQWLGERLYRLTKQQLILRVAWPSKEPVPFCLYPAASPPGYCTKKQKRITIYMLQGVPYLDDLSSSYEKVVVRKLLKDATFPLPFLYSCQPTAPCVARISPAPG